MAALQDESSDGEQENEDEREVEFGTAESADHANSPYCWCVSVVP
jgi:hypothetical protein